jgi:hypothetical protein
MSPCRSRWPARCPRQPDASGYCLSHRVARQRAHQLTTNGYTHPTRLRAYLTTWTARGRHLTTLARLADINPRILFEIHAGRIHRVRPGITETICAIPPPPSDIGCVRRLQALAVRGHTLRHTANQIGPTTTYAALAQALGTQQFGDTLAYTIANYYPTAILRPGS